MILIGMAYCGSRIISNTKLTTRGVSSTAAARVLVYGMDCGLVAGYVAVCCCLLSGFVRTFNVIDRSNHEHYVFNEFTDQNHARSTVPGSLVDY